MDSNRVPLFINRFSLSPRTAIGVQTVRLMGPHRDWLHFHWWSNSLRQLDPRSILFENAVLSRYSFLHNPALMSICERLGISSWSGDDLRPAHSKRLIAQYRDRVSSVYLAPLDESDAGRCLELVKLIGAPFVLHLWDVLHGDVSRGALRELVDRADIVFCVSQPLLNDVSLIRGDAELLSFSRDAATVTATPREKGPLKVVMHGNIFAYTEGLDDLEEAIALLKPSGLKVEVTFIGSPKVLRQTNAAIRKRVNAIGFQPNQAALDKALGLAHIAFLPGPKRDPRVDLRSRYSIPSRLLDYMAVNLPVVGTIHMASATRVFLHELGLDAATACTTGKEVADWLLRLSGREAWEGQSANSRRAFNLLQHQEPPAERLKRALDEIA
jgi:glycosyltransferase involved in cell wall biosynthesis